MIEIAWVQDAVRQGRFFVSRHADEERLNDNLTLEELRQALLTGIVIEQYEDTGRGESCLVAGFTATGKPIHCVCGRRGDRPVVVTTYVPTPPRFKNPFERGTP